MLCVGVKENKRIKEVKSKYKYNFKYIAKRANIMTKFNLRKKASAGDAVISDKGIDKNRKDMNLSNDQQGVVGKNINLSLPTKDKDNTIPFNQQLEASRKNETKFSITEASMDDKITDFKSTDKKQVMDINVESRKFIDKQSDAYKKAENASKSDTEFWDKYVGEFRVQCGEPEKGRGCIWRRDLQGGHH